MCGGGGGGNARRRMRRMQQQMMAMQQQQAHAAAVRRQQEAAARAAQQRALAQANKQVARPDESLQSTAGGQASVRRRRQRITRKAGQAGGDRRFNIDLNMGGYRGRSGGAPNV